MARAGDARYWSDEAYTKFYGSSQAEQGLLNRPPGAAELGAEQLGDFQAAFAEWSAGTGQLKASDFRRFLLQLRVDMSPAQARSLWATAAIPGGAEAAPQRLGYAQVLELYRQVLENPVEFKTGPNACPPGKAPAPLPDLVPAEEQDVAAAWSLPALPSRSAQPIHGRFGSSGGSADRAAAEPARAPGSGLHLSLGEARELLLAESLPSAEVEAMLRKFSGSGAVPQAALFDFLERRAGALEAPGGDPHAALRPERLRPAAAPPPAAASRPPTLA